MKNIGGACKIGKMKNTKNFYWKTWREETMRKT